MTKIYDPKAAARQVLKVLADHNTPIFAVEDVFELVSEWIGAQEVRYQTSSEETAAAATTADISQVVEEVLDKKYEKLKGIYSSESIL